MFESAQGGCLFAVERLFQSFTPLNEKHFLPFSVPFFGNLRSVDVLRSLYDVLCDFFLNKLHKYGGASSFKVLKTIVRKLLLVYFVKPTEIE